MLQMEQMMHCLFCNYNDHSVIVSMEQSYENMITHETVENVVELKPYDVAIFKRSKLKK